tara:strand:+ start:331 stop:486 length:156 start_codon:yes stop_codon:yes gene_type:complete
MTDEFKESQKTEEDRKAEVLKQAAMFKQLLNPLANLGKGNKIDGNISKPGS